MRGSASRPAEKNWRLVRCAAARSGGGGRHHAAGATPLPGCGPARACIEGLYQADAALSGQQVVIELLWLVAQGGHHALPGDDHPPRRGGGVGRGEGHHGVPPSGRSLRGSRAMGTPQGACECREQGPLGRDDARGAFAWLRTPDTPHLCCRTAWRWPIAQPCARRSASTWAHPHRMPSPRVQGCCIR